MACFLFPFFGEKHVPLFVTQVIFYGGRHCKHDDLGILLSFLFNLFVSCLDMLLSLQLGSFCKSNSVSIILKDFVNGCFKDTWIMCSFCKIVAYSSIIIIICSTGRSTDRNNLRAPRLFSLPCPVKSRPSTSKLGDS